MKNQSMNSEDLVKLATAALEELKAQHIDCIDVRKKPTLTDFMLIATSTSSRHASALVEKVREVCKAAGVMPLSEEGKGDSEWVLIDLGDVVVHVMTAPARQFYNLEALWKGAEQGRINMLTGDE